MAGKKTLDELGVHTEVVPAHFSVKEKRLPVQQVPRRGNIILGPEMRSTGKVMGIAETFPDGLREEQMAASSPFADGGFGFISVADRDKPDVVRWRGRWAEDEVSAAVDRVGTAPLLRGGRHPPWTKFPS